MTDQGGRQGGRQRGRKGGRVAVAVSLTIAASLAAQAAWACPACASREGPGASVLALLAGFIAVPYAIAAVTIRVLRRLEKP